MSALIFLHFRHEQLKLVSVVSRAWLNNNANVRSIMSHSLFAVYRRPWRERRRSGLCSGIDMRFLLIQSNCLYVVDARPPQSSWRRGNSHMILEIFIFFWQ